MRFSRNTLRDKAWNTLRLHGEKALCIAVCVSMVLLVWISSLQKNYENTTPGKMSNMADRAKEVIDRNDSWEKIKPYRKANLEAAEKIIHQPRFDAKAYAFSNLFGSTIAMRPRRNDPGFLPPQALQVQYVRAPVGTASPGKGDSIKRQLDRLPRADRQLTNVQRFESFFYRPTWSGGGIGNIKVIDAIAGTAVIPFSDQQMEFENTFVTARNYDVVRDRPRYAILDVQRREDASLPWESITAHVYSAMDGLSSKARDPSDRRHRVKNLSLDIPPLLGINYLPLALHPQIPIVDLSDKFLTEPSEDETVSEPESGKPPATLRLIRFFDTQPKEPGKQYQYRVRAWLMDPNDPGAVHVSSQAVATGPTIARGNVQADAPSPGDEEEDDGQESIFADRDPLPLFVQDLSPEVRKRQARVYEDKPSFPEHLRGFEDVLSHAVPTPWSKPSDWVTVSNTPSKIHLGSIKAANEDSKARSDGDIAKVAVSVFSEEHGTSIRSQTSIQRGSVLNFSAPGRVLHIGDLTVRDLTDEVDRSGDPLGHWFETGLIVVDLMGGKPLASGMRSDRFQAPGDMLVMDSQGNFQIHNDLDDQTGFRHTIFEGN